MEIIIVGVIVAIVSSVLSIFISKKLNNAKFEIYITQAKAKAKVIEHEAEVLLKDSQIKARKECEVEFRHAKKEYDDMFYKLQKKEKELNEHLEAELKDIKKEKAEIIEKNKKITTIKCFS